MEIQVESKTVENETRDGDRETQEKTSFAARD
jgi:hypothetical protein